MSQVIPPATTTKTIQSSATVSRKALRCNGWSREIPGSNRPNPFENEREPADAAATISSELRARQPVLQRRRIHSPKRALRC